MTARVRVDTDVVFQQGDTATITVGSLTEHLSPSISSAQTISGTVGTTAVSISGAGPLSTLALKNTGQGMLRVAGAVDLSPGRLAILPITATVTVAVASGQGSYSCIWVG